MRFFDTEVHFLSQVDYSISMRKQKEDGAGL